MNKITEFRGEYRWLSNFWPCKVFYDGHEFPSVEHAYVYSKTLIPEEQQLVLGSRNKTAGQLKRIGKELTLRKDWADVRIGLMRLFVREKFTNNFDLQKKLLDTGDSELIEGNLWGDIFWGKCKGVGKNWLGKILMEIREELKFKED